MIKASILTVIVPRLPPSIDGLGDYGLSLAKQMRKDFGIVSKFIVADPSWLGPSIIEGFQVSKVSHRSKAELLKLLPANSSVLLHYVGYGYAKRGCPIWLVQGLKEWRDFSQKKCVTMFHECYAFGPLWTSQFWTSPIQRLIVRELAILSDNCLTSKNEYAEIIQKYSSHKHSSVSVLPVFSNVGELETALRLDERDPTLVVFGSKGCRKRVYENSLAQLKVVIKRLKIRKLIDIGSELDIPIRLLNEVEVEIRGNLPAEEISKIFSNSLAGFLNYPPGFLAKSGIFASYCAHGVLPIGSWDEDQKCDGVLVGVHLLKADDVSQEISLDKFQEVADNAFTWYRSHSLAVHSKKFADILD